MRRRKQSKPKMKGEMIMSKEDCQNCGSSISSVVCDDSWIESTTGTYSTSNYFVMAEVRNGNQLTTGVTELAVKMPGGASTAHKIFDQDGSPNTINADPVYFDLVFEQGASPAPHTANLLVACSNEARSVSLERTDPIIGISAVAVYAVVTNAAGKNLRAQWTSCTLTFYDEDSNSISKDLHPVGTNPNDHCILPCAVFGNPPLQATHRWIEEDPRAKNVGGTLVTPGSNPNDSKPWVRVSVTGTCKFYGGPPNIAPTAVMAKVYIWVNT